MSERNFFFTVSEISVGLRLDKFVSQVKQVGSRSRAEYLIENQCVKVNNFVLKSSYKLKQNDVVNIILPEEKIDQGIAPYSFSLDILYEDKDLIVLNKPAGLVVHPAAGHQDDTLVNALVHHTDELSMKFGEDRPGIVHRLDKETSGVLVVAKNDIAHENLTTQFKNRTIERKYEAVVIGNLNRENGTISSIIARHSSDRKKFASLKEKKSIIANPSESIHVKGKKAITHFHVLKRSQNLTLVELKLETGRTHQIRVHLSEYGVPIVNDVLYGSKKYETKISKNTYLELKTFHRFFLHAKTLGFIHPRTNEKLLFEVNWPSQELDFINKIFYEHK